MTYSIVKNTKSTGIAILLTLIFGPIGLFYASILGGFIMTFVPIIVAIMFFIGAIGGNNAIFFSSFIIMVIGAAFHWIICILWAVIGVSNYNKKLFLEAMLKNQPNINSNNSSQNQSPNTNTIQNSEFEEWKKNNPNSSINNYYRDRNY